MSTEARQRLWKAWTAAHGSDDVETVTVSKADLGAVLKDEIRGFGVLTRIRAELARYETDQRGAR